MHSILSSTSAAVQRMHIKIIYTCQATCLHDEDTERKTVKTVCEGLPQLDTVPSLALVIKPIYPATQMHNIYIIYTPHPLPVDAGSLVVASEKKDVLRVLHLVGQNETYSLQRHLTSVQQTNRYACCQDLAQGGTLMMEKTVTCSF